uniref:Ubiquitin-like protease family profile domain-containing protein n=1 Tax=Branchiostoma floridae TaxID=7739 RepID=C3XYA3_BRAFL|eukprot:XP_002610778.1 hypothetical protein BRAFLDRAFT_126316 [Branchiostoma floridae]
MPFGWKVPLVPFATAIGRIFQTENPDSASDWKEDGLWAQVTQALGFGNTYNNRRRLKNFWSRHRQEIERLTKKDDLELTSPTLWTAASREVEEPAEPLDAGSEREVEAIEDHLVHSQGVENGPGHPAAVSSKDIINVYMEMIVQRGKLQGKPKVHAFDTYFYTKLMNEGPSSLERWTQKTDIFTMDLVLVPIHLEVHWCMAVIDIRRKCIKYYDSMGGPNDDGINALWKYLEVEHERKTGKKLDLSKWTSLYPENIPKQTNSSDCGVFACQYAECETRDAAITFTQADIPKFRRQMASEIKNKKLESPP